MPSLTLGKLLLQNDEPTHKASARTREPTRSTFQVLLACLPLRPRQSESESSRPAFECRIDQGLMTEIDQLAAAQDKAVIGLGSRLAHGVAWLRAAYDPKIGLVLRHELACQGVNHSFHSLAANVLLNQRISSSRPALQYFAVDSELAPKVDGFRWSYPPTTNNLDPNVIDEAVHKSLAKKYEGIIPTGVRNYFKKKPTRLSGIPDGLCSDKEADDCLAAEEQKLAALGAVDHLALAVADSSVEVEVSLDPTTGKPKLKCEDSYLFAKYTAQILEGMIVFKHAVTIFTQGDRSVVVVWKEPNVLRVSYVVHHTENGVQSSSQEDQPAPAFSRSMSLAILKRRWQSMRQRSDSRRRQYNTEACPHPAKAEDVYVCIY